jgi:hypothetical protein
MALLSLFQVRRSESSSDTGLGEKKANSSTNEADWTQHGTYGVISSGVNFPSVASLPDTRRMVVETTLKKLLDARHFSICELDKILEIIGSRQSGEAYKLLSALHCINYSDMNQELRDRIPLLVNECLRQQTKTSEIVDAVLKGVEI